MLTEVDPWTRGPISPRLLSDIIKQNVAYEGSFTYYAHLIGDDPSFLIHQGLKDLGILHRDENRELLLSFPPRRHKNSKAEYFIDGKIIGTHRLYASYLAKDSETSIHYHQKEPRPVSEIYLVTKGILYVIVNGELYCLDANKNNKLVIEPGLTHQAFTNRSFALVDILMQNAASIPEDKVHIPDKSRASEFQQIILASRAFSR